MFLYYIIFFIGFDQEFKKWNWTQVCHVCHMTWLIESPIKYITSSYRMDMKATLLQSNLYLSTQSRSSLLIADPDHLDSSWSIQPVHSLMHLSHPPVIDEPPSIRTSTKPKGCNSLFYKIRSYCILSLRYTVEVNVQDPARHSSQPALYQRVVWVQQLSVLGQWTLLQRYLYWRKR